MDRDAFVRALKPLSEIWEVRWGEGRSVQPISSNRMF